MDNKAWYNLNTAADIFEQQIDSVLSDLMYSGTKKNGKSAVENSMRDRYRAYSEIESVEIDKIWWYMIYCKYSARNIFTIMDSIYWAEKIGDKCINQKIIDEMLNGLMLADCLMPNSEVREYFQCAVVSNFAWKMYTSKTVSKVINWNRIYSVKDMYIGCILDYRMDKDYDKIKDWFVVNNENELQEIRKRYGPDILGNIVQASAGNRFWGISEFRNKALFSVFEKAKTFRDINIDNLEELAGCSTHIGDKYRPYMKAISGIKGLLIAEDKKTFLLDEDGQWTIDWPDFLILSKSGVEKVVYNKEMEVSEIYKAVQDKLSENDESVCLLHSIYYNDNRFWSKRAGGSK